MKTGVGRGIASCQRSIRLSYRGALTAAEYFNRDTEDEREIRTLADAIYAGPIGNGREIGKTR